MDSDKSADSLERVVTDLFSYFNKNYKALSFVLFLVIGGALWVSLSQPKDEEVVNQFKSIEKILNLSNSTQEDINTVISFAEDPIYLKKYGVDMVQYLVNHNELSVARKILSKIEDESLYSKFSAITLDVYAGDLKSAKAKSETLANLLKGSDQSKLIFFNIQQQRYINHLLEE